MPGAIEVGAIVIFRARWGSLWGRFGEHVRHTQTGRRIASEDAGDSRMVCDLADRARGGKRSVPIVEVGAPVAGIHSATGVLDVFSALLWDDVLVTMA